MLAYRMPLLIAKYSAVLQLQVEVQHCHLRHSFATLGMAERRSLRGFVGAML
jgi:hypothetical protein